MNNNKLTGELSPKIGLIESARPAILTPQNHKAIVLSPHASLQFSDIYRTDGTDNPNDLFDIKMTNLATMEDGTHRFTNNYPVLNMTPSNGIPTWTLPTGNTQWEAGFQGNLTVPPAQFYNWPLADVYESCQIYAVLKGTTTEVPRSRFSYSLIFRGLVLMFQNEINAYYSSSANAYSAEVSFQFSSNPIQQINPKGILYQLSLTPNSQSGYPPFFCYDLDWLINSDGTWTVSGLMWSYEGSHTSQSVMYTARLANNVLPSNDYIWDRVRVNFL